MPRHQALYHTYVLRPVQVALELVFCPPTHAQQRKPLEVRSIPSVACFVRVCEVPRSIVLCPWDMCPLQETCTQLDGGFDARGVAADVRGDGWRRRCTPHAAGSVYKVLEAGEARPSCAGVPGRHPVDARKSRRLVATGCRFSCDPAF